LREAYAELCVELYDEYTSFSADNDRAQSEVKNLQGWVEDLRNSVEDLKARFEIVKNTVESLKGGVDTLKKLEMADGMEDGLRYC
jgi:peptidoglycan hydrolase CwlO-like protein